ncbi:MAG: permease [Terracidiphilus sp.]
MSAPQTSPAPLLSASPRPSDHRGLEIALALLLAVSIAGIFWTGQRYPALLKKLHAGQSLKVGGAISFDALLPVVPTMSLTERVGRTSVNWLWTNRFGMYFALPFGAALMTFMARTLRPKRFEHSAANVLCGAVAGAPMGVCTNCATPIGQSLLVSGASTRMTVAGMISSPSFNPVVLAMAFLLFPWPMAAARVLVPLLLLLALPWLVNETKPKIKTANIPDWNVKSRTPLSSVAASFLRNLLRLTLLTLPWMLLAAVLGALAAELIPAYGTHLPVSMLGVVAVAALGTLLPVPMALDVGLAWVLYRAGTPAPYVAALLCTLGPISIYSLTGLGQQLGFRTSFRLAATVALLGSVAGLIFMLH